MKRERWTAVSVLAVLLCGAIALAQTSTVNQGKPGTQGPWPVTVVGPTDGGSTTTVITSTLPCKTLTQSVTQVGPVATTVPASPAVGRVWIQVCNGVLNSSSLQCVCEATAKPTFSVSSAGDTLATGDCATYNVGNTDGGQPWCLCNADAGTSYLVSAECIPF